MAYHHTAQGLASLGRRGDDTLLHINKDELAGLEALLGPVSVNPETGMPEAFQWWELVAGLAAGVLTMGAGAALAGAIGGGLAATSAGTAAAAGSAGAAGTAGTAGAGLIGGGAATTTGAIGTGAAVTGAGTGAAATGAGTGAAATGAGTGAAATGAGTGAAATGAGTGAAATGAGTGAAGTGAAATGAGTGAAGTGAAATGAAAPAAVVDPLATASEVALSSGTPGATATGQTVGQVATEQAMGQVANAAPQTFAEGAMQGMADTASAWTNPANYTFANAAEYGPMAATIGAAELEAIEAPGKRRAAEKQAQGTADMWNQNIQNTMGVLGYKGDPGQFYVGPNGVLQATTPQIFTSGFGQARATGGLVALGNVQGIPVQVDVPEQDVDTVEQGVRSLGGQGFANGGYANTQPFDPQQFYPQSHIPSAQPYAAAGNTRVLDTLHSGASFNRGGYAKGEFLDGPGDGMSDDIPANIDGREPVKLADGEFIIPADVVSILGNGSSKAGAQVLQQGLAAIRKAGTGNHQQVKQDAGRMAFERVVKKAGKKRAHSKRTA